MYKRCILLACLVLLTMESSFSVEQGYYFCAPVHARHLIQQEDGEVTELVISTKDAAIIILIDETSINITDSRIEKVRLIDVTENVHEGSILGHSGYSRFYMDSILHYFYGSTDPDNTIAYVEDGMCQKAS